ncbi:MAG: glycerate kinase [Sedimentisphaerales bacterium]|nr:glycerate kinase [Sedimentisphaerales bacterium]
MKIVLAPDSFKDSLTAAQVCAALEIGIRRVLPNAQILHLPMADGGEGTVAAMVAATNGTFHTAEVLGPLADSNHSAQFGMLGNTDTPTAVIEMAAASGLPLVPEEKRNPLHTTTFGLGQLILAALQKGARNFLIGIGGSATNDCGVGMAQALGVKFFDASSKEITAPITGQTLANIASFDTSALPPELTQAQFSVACDVENPLLGPNGATCTYAPQKGATPPIVATLEANLTQFAQLLESTLNKSIINVPGSGAAGGLGAALLAFLNADLSPGIQIVLQHTQFAQKIKDADLIITGEGQIDGSTAFGKTIAGIAHQAQIANIPLIAIAGSLGPDAHKILSLGVQAILSITNAPITLQQAIQNAPTLLADTAEQAIRLITLNPPRLAP